MFALELSLLNTKSRVLYSFCKFFLQQETASRISFKHLWKVRTITTANVSIQMQFQQIIGCTSDEAENFFEQFPKLKQTPPERIQKTVEFLTKKGISKELLKRHSWLLTYSAATLQSKFSAIGKGESNDTTLLLLCCSQTRLKDMVTKLGSKDLLSEVAVRLGFFCKELGINTKQALEMFQAHPPLLTMELERLQRIMDMLKGSFVSNDAILKDLWIFRHNEKVMMDRIQKAKSSQVLVKTWMLRCPQETFDRHLKRWEARVNVIKPHSDTVDYLAERLNCSQDYIRTLSEKNTRLLTINAPKLKKVLDFLFANGYTSQQVCMFPRILSRSYSKIQERLHVLKALDVASPSLYTLCSTEKEYARFIKRLKSEKQQKETAVSST